MKKIIWIVVLKGVLLGLDFLALKMVSIWVSQNLTGKSYDTAAIISTLVFVALMVFILGFAGNVKESWSKLKKRLKSDIDIDVEND